MSEEEKERSYIHTVIPSLNSPLLHYLYKHNILSKWCLQKPSSWKPVFFLLSTAIPFAVAPFSLCTLDPHPHTLKSRQSAQQYTPEKEKLALHSRQNYCNTRDTHIATLSLTCSLCSNFCIKLMGHSALLKNSILENT